MKPFQGIIRGAGKQPATQLGTTKSGMQVELNTIDWGIKITAVKTPGNSIVMEICLTNGSTGPSATKHLTTIRNQEIIQNDNHLS